MSFLIQRASGRGLTLTQIQGPVLRIGRGTNQELRSENPAVALEHGTIEGDAAGYFVTDKGSITGTYVNGRPVESARLVKGDLVEIGDLRMEVQIAEPTKPLFLRITTTRSSAAFVEEEEEEAPASAVPGAHVVRAKRIDYLYAYRLARPWLTKVSLTAILLIVALGLVGELIRPENHAFFMPGGLSSAHARAHERDGRIVADDCRSCHTPWRSVNSSKCLDCHGQRPHALYGRGEPDCFLCHAEHRGATKLAALADPTCTTCHANLAAHMRLPRPQLVELRFANGRYPFEAMAGIEAFGDRHPELTYPPDTDTLRFNHKLHLVARGVLNGSGRRVVLECKGCHQLVTVKEKTEPGPIDFKSQCQSCHRLTFDARFPNVEVPHGGDAQIAYGFVLAMYSGDRDIAGKPPAEVRRLLAAGKRIAPDAQGVLNAQQVIKTRCRICHDLVPRGPRLDIVRPVIRTQWLPNARFTHGRHLNVACQSCHKGVPQSSATADVLMPRRADCASCHARGSGQTQAASTCVTCHEYHLHPKRPIGDSSLVQAGMGGLGREGRMFQGILLAVIVVLVLVVLVPVGIALFRRLLPDRTPPSRERGPAPVPPATMKMPALRVEGPTDRVVKRPSERPPDPTPPHIKETRVITPDVPRTEAPAGTEMMLWYGMLHCTSGPIEGQRFIIEDDGFYIGRDPSLAKVVVPDTRVSKRHVRIVPRDGKVWAIDQSSTNGTFLHDERITEVQLKRGDTLVLGDNAATFVYQI
jgi:pSer/pThr/pTyr-binding forkhead associated (FHA) protein